MSSAGCRFVSRGRTFCVAWTTSARRSTADRVLRVFEMSLAAAAWAATPQWIHGDPHTANLIIRDDALVGVIDFGDLCAGDPATDLAGGFLSLPIDSIDGFLRAYGEIDDATIRRTLGWAVHFGLMFILLGESDEPTYGPIGYRAIENALGFASDGA